MKLHTFRLFFSDAQVAVKVQVRSWDVYWLSLPNRVGLGIICL
jgi:hypothetical protein